MGAAKQTKNFVLRYEFEYYIGRGTRLSEDCKRRHGTELE